MEDTNERGYSSLIEAVKNDCSKGENCFNENGCDKERYINVPQDNPKLLEMGIKTSCKANTKCFHDYCGKFKWIMDRAKHYAEALGSTTEDVLKDWEQQRSYWYFNFYQEGNQPLIDNVKVFNTIAEFKESIKNEGFRCPKCSEASTNAYECSMPKCDWKSYGLFGTMGKGADVVVKEHSKHRSHIFMPIAWESNSESTKLKTE